MSSNKIIDLELGEDGTYGPVKKNKAKVNIVRHEEKAVKSKSVNCVPPEQAFLMGVDYGLDFLEGVASRLNRLSRIIK
jgi:hypothetical protein